MNGTAPSLLIISTIPDTYEAFLRPYAAHLHQRGWRVDLATGRGAVPGEPGGVLGRVWTIPWARRLVDPRNATTALRQVRRAMAHGYDIVHTHTPIASVVSRAAHATLAPAARARLVYTAHGFHFAPQNRRRANLPYVAAERLMGRWTDRLVVINRTDFEQALRFGVVPAERLVHHPGIGVDTAWYAVTADVRAAADRFRADLGIPAGAPAVTMAAELRINKHPELAVEALVRSRRSGLHLVLAGEGPMRERIVAQAAAAGVTDRVHLVGMLADIRTAFAASVATVLPSQREGLSRAVLESLAMGIPVIGSDIRGIADLVAPDGGVLVPLGDVDALADALALAADDRVPFDAAAVRRRIERHGLAHLLGLHEELYDSLLTDEGAPSRPNTTASPAGVAAGR